MSGERPTLAEVLATHAGGMTYWAHPRGWKCECGDLFSGDVSVGEARLTHAQHVESAALAWVLDMLADEALERDVAYALARRHRCLDHNGPHSGPCGTDRERATLVLAAVRQRFEAER